MLCCKSIAEERRAGNLHAALCGSRRWVTASGDPVLEVKFLRSTRRRPDVKGEAQVAAPQEPEYRGGA